MMYNNKKCLSFLILIFTTVFSEPFKVNPILFIHYSSNGNDWIYDSQSIINFGAGINLFLNNGSWTVEGEYTQLGFLGKIDNGLYEFSEIKSLAYLDESKDADGYWNETVKAKFIYNSNSLQFEFGIFDRKWGYGNRAIHISDKPPSYPQFGFKWNIRKNLSLTYFHGFLNSGIVDSGRATLYDNQISKRTFNISRNISAHKIEWIPIEKLSICLNETVIYASRMIDIHYLIPIAPFYPIENYLGDTDNLQIGLDLSYSISAEEKIYLGFFMDELTPEWLFNDKNHNWFGWQFGYKHENLIFNDSKFLMEYNWTDQRIYKHKYVINDYYSHEQPLGFWAGPHAEELLVHYKIPLRNNIILFNYSFAKRGLVSDESVKNNYNDSHNERFSEGFESRNFISLRLILKSKSLKRMEYLIGINKTIFNNIGFSKTNNGINSNKFSFEIGVCHNFYLPYGV